MARPQGFTRLVPEARVGVHGASHRTGLPPVRTQPAALGRPAWRLPAASRRGRRATSHRLSTGLPRGGTRPPGGPPIWRTQGRRPAIRRSAAHRRPSRLSPRRPPAPHRLEGNGAERRTSIARLRAFGHPTALRVGQHRHHDSRVGGVPARRPGEHGLGGRFACCLGGGCALRRRAAGERRLSGRGPADPPRSITFARTADAHPRSPCRHPAVDDG